MTNLPRRTVAKDGPHPIDVHVVSRVRLRRTLLGMNQTQLGEKLGITYQQVQKYEQGATRISASRLYQMTRILDVPVSFFFDDMPPDTENALPHPVSSGALGGVMLKRETLELVRAYYRIGDPAARIRNACRHRRGDPKRLVDAREIVMHKIDRERVNVVLDLF